MSDGARTYLRNEAKYLRERSPAAAKALTAAMRRAHETLATFGEVGRAMEGLPIPGIRRLIVGNYLLDYEIFRRLDPRPLHLARPSKAAGAKGRRRF